MATTVQSFVGGGTDLTELTSGELLFCSLLKTGYIQVKANDADYTYVNLGFDNWNVDTNGKGIDMSKISQISLVASAYTSGGRVTWENVSGHTEISYSANTHFSISAPSGDNSHSTFSIHSSGTGAYGVVKVTSFTTTDGKAHTASNLNY